MRLVLNSLHDEVAAKLRERIFAGDLAPGRFIDEPALCAELSISRKPLREALKVLTAEGLVRHMFAETSTLGVRMYDAERRVQAREIREVETPYGRVRIKVGESGDFAPEYEDCLRIAREHGIALKRVIAEAARIFASR